MNNTLDRLITGIITTLRSDIIPNVDDSYARGQAVGIIDLLDNIAARIEWSREPIIEAIRRRKAIIEDVSQLLGAEVKNGCSGADLPGASVSELIEERDRLDSEVADLLVLAMGKGRPDERAHQALSKLRQHLHEDAAIEMKLTKRPLFAEIAKGRRSDKPVVD